MKITMLEVAETDQLIADRCRALANPLRLSMLRYIATHPGCICNDLVVRTRRAQSTISTHLHMLVRVGLLDTEANTYWVSEDTLALLCRDIATLLHD